MGAIKETLNANETKRFEVPGRFVRVMNSTGNVEFTFYRKGTVIDLSGDVSAGYAETFDGEGFDAFTVKDKSGAANVLEMVHRMSQNVRYDRAAGNVNLLGGVVTNLQKQAAPDAKIWGGGWASNASLAANTPVQIIAPATNVNGVEIIRAVHHCVTGGGFHAFIAKAGAAPANITDGYVLDMAYGQLAKIEQPIFVPAGMGIYAINSAAEGTVMRSMLLRVL